MTEDLRPPYRIQFDNARDPYTARNALGIAGTGAGLITSVTSPLSVTGGNLTIDLSGYQSLAGVTDGSNAAAGVIGEYLEYSGSGPIAASTGTAYVALTLTPGDWDVWAAAVFVGGTASARAFISVSTNAAAFGPTGSTGMVPISGSTDAYVATPLVRVSISASTVYYGVLLSDSNVSSVASKICARRRR